MLEKSQEKLETFGLAESGGGKPTLQDERQCKDRTDSCASKAVRAGVLLLHRLELDQPQQGRQGSIWMSDVERVKKKTTHRSEGKSKGEPS